MRVVFSIVGQVEPYPNVEVDMDAVPREGEPVALDDLRVFVRTVEWFPQGDPETGAVDDPFVYVVLGDRRPE